MVRNRYILLGTLLGLLALPAAGQGLHFRGNDYPIENRTSLMVRPRSEISEALVVRFDFSPTRESDAGYVFRAARAVEEANPGGLCLFFDSQGDEWIFRVILEGHRFLSELSIPKQEILPGQWFPVRFEINPQKDSVLLEVGPYAAGSALTLEDPLRPVICFGKNEYRIDIPSFDMRNLSITADRKTWDFPLNEDSGNTARSTQSSLQARLSNPEWLNQDRIHWKKCFSRFSRQFKTCGYDPANQEVYVIGQDSLLRLSVGKSTLREERTADRNPLHTFLGSSFPGEEGYYCYEPFYEGEENAGVPTLAVLDRETLRWKVLSTWQFPTQLHHHDLIIDTLRGCHYLYGGFGNRLYNGQFYRLDSLQWHPVAPLSGDPVWPRYFASAGWDPAADRIYLFGGMGNESGDHIVGRQYMYDFFEIDPETFRATKRWELPPQNPQKVPVRNMVLPGDGCFYTLFYPESNTETELYLYRVSLQDGSMTRYSDALPMNSDRILTNANLYYDPLLQKLIAVIEESTNDIDSRVTVYTLSFPPLEERLSTVAKGRIQWGVVLLLLVLAAGLAIGLSARHRKGTNKLNASAARPALTPLPPAPDSIFLFGGFAAYDAKGDDLSSQFPEKIRHLLLLILQGEDNGVSSKRLRVLLWPDKDDDRAKNLRGVTMNKLRKALSAMDGVSIVYEDGHFILRQQPPFQCDYLLLQQLLREESPDMDKVLRILSRGAFLMGESDPLLDRMKELTENRVFPVVQSEMKRRFLLRDYPNAILCADILAQTDPLDEEALLCKIQALRLGGHDDDARSVYQQFITRYKREYGEDYPHSFEELLTATLD